MNEKLEESKSDALKFLQTELELVDEDYEDAKEEMAGMFN